jgi:hypothetical protein
LSSQRSVRPLQSTRATEKKAAGLIMVLPGCLRWRALVQLGIDLNENAEILGPKPTFTPGPSLVDF